MSTVRTENVAEAIRGIDYCAHLMPETLQAFAGTCQVHRPPAGGVLRLACPAHSVLVVVSGAARLEESDERGEVAVSRVVVRGDIVGSLQERTAESRVVCLRPSRVELMVVLVRRSELLSLLLSCPRSATLLLLHVESRRSILEGRFNRLQNLPVDQRVAAALADLLVLCRCDSLQSSVIPIDLRQADVGDLAGASRQATNRVLRSLSSDGVLEQCGCRFFINDIPALKRRAERWETRSDRRMMLQ